MSREELPKGLATWYDYTKWVLDRVDGFPKNQRFILGTRLADGVVDVLPARYRALYRRPVAFGLLRNRGARASRPCFLIETGGTPVPLPEPMVRDQGDIGITHGGRYEAEGSGHGGCFTTCLSRIGWLHRQVAA